MIAKKIKIIALFLLLSRPFFLLAVLLSQNGRKYRIIFPVTASSIVVLAVHHYPM